MSTQVATAYVDMKPDFSGFNREVASKLAPITKNFGGQFGKALGPVMEQQAKHMRTLATGAKYAAAGGAALAAVVGKDIVTAGMKFEKQMSINAAVSEANRKEMLKLERQSIRLGKATFFSATEAAEAQGELVKGGLKVSQVLGGGLPAALQLAEAGQLELATAAETTVNAMKLFGLQGREAGSVADMLSTAANRTTADVLDFAMALKQGGSVTKLAGYEMNETVTVLEALAEAGIKNSDAGTSMKTAVIQLLKPSEKQNKLAKELHLHWVDQNGELKSAAGLSRELRIATEGMTKAERAKTFATLAGTDGVRTLNALYAETPAQLRALEVANARQGTAQDIAAKKMDNFAGTWEQFKGTLETVEIQIYKGAAPALEELTEEATQAAARVGAVFENPNLSGGEKVERAVSVLRDELGRIWDRNEMSEHLLDALDYALDTAVPRMAENAGDLGIAAAKGFVHGFTHADFLGKVVMGAWLLNFIGGRAAFVGLGKMVGRQFGMSFASEAAVAASGAGLAGTTAMATAGASVASGLTPVQIRQAAQAKAAAQRAQLVGAMESFTLASVASPATQQALEQQGRRSATQYAKRWAGQAASALSTVGPRLARGIGTWGLGGIVVGELTKEIVGGDAGSAIGGALEGAGIGAAIGTAIAPGIGTGIGAAAGVLTQGFKEAVGGSEMGKELAAGLAGSFNGAIPQLKHAIDSKRLGKLEGLRSELRRAIHAAVAAGADDASLKPLRDRLGALSSEIRKLQIPRELVAENLDVLGSGLATRLSDINHLFQTNLHLIDEGWKKGGHQWREATAQSMRATVSAIKDGMRAGVIETGVGKARIKELLRDLRLVEGRDPFGLAQGFANGWRDAGRINNREITQVIRDMQRMPKGSRESAQDAMIQMARALEAKGELVKGSAARLQSALVTKFGKTNKQLVSGVSGAVAGIAGLFDNLAGAVGTVLKGIGIDVSNFAKALGVPTKGIEFSIHAGKGAANAVGRAIEDIVPGMQTGGTFIVPGTGSGDTFLTALEPGSFVENREAVRGLPLQKGGPMPVALEPGERVWLPQAVRAVGRRTLEARNDAIPRFQKGGGIGPEPRLLGPDPLRSLGQAGVHQGYQAALEWVKRHRPDGGLMGLGDAPAQLQAAMALARQMGLTITSTTGGQHAPGSYHYLGRAFDASNGVGTPEERAYAIAAAKKWGRHILELFFDPLGWYIKDGQKISGAIGGHSDHVHTAMQLGGLIQKLASGGAVVKLAGKVLGRHGLDLTSSAGIMGNSYQESGWDTEAMEPGTDNGGLFGFTAGDKSRAALVAFAQRQGEPWGDTETQVQFMLTTLPQSMRDAMNRMGSLKDTTRYFMEQWERPNEALANFPRRLEGAKKAAQIFKGMDFEGGGGGANHLPAEVGYHEKGGVTGTGGGTTAPAKGNVKTEKLSDFGALPDTVEGVQRELTKRRAELGRYRAALRSNKDPEVKQALEANVNLLRNRIKALLEQRKRLLHRKALEAVKAKIAKRGTLPGVEQAISSAERAYESASEEAEQIAGLEPEEGGAAKAYIESREAPAWARVLGTEARWRNALISGEAAAAVRLRSLEAQEESLNALKATNPKAFNKQKFRLPAIRQAIASIRELYTPAQAKSLKDLEAGRFSVAAGGSFEEALVNLQGIGKSTVPMDSLPTEPVPGSFGGLIWDTQMSIRELGLKIKQSLESSEDNSELLAVMREIAEREHKGRLVAERLSDTAAGFYAAYPGGNLPPYAGKAHSGAVVPGPPTEERTMIVRGQERIRTPEQELGLAQAIRGLGGGALPIVEHHVHGTIISDREDPVETVLRDPRTGQVIRRTRGGRVTQGGPRQ